MGTRNLTCVVLGGEYKVAQYGQWDGYPSGQGVTALNFLRGMDRENFTAKVRATRFIDAAETAALDTTDWMKTHPQLSRRNGAKILQLVADAEPGIPLVDQHQFAADGLMCEWVYVIDLDKSTFEVFKGFNEQPLAEGERFAGLDPVKYARCSYYPVKHRHTFDLAALPTEEEFLVILEPTDECDDR